MDAISMLRRFDQEKLLELCRFHLTVILDLSDDAFSLLLDKDSGKKKQRTYFSRFLKAFRLHLQYFSILISKTLADKSITEVMPLNAATINHIYQIIEFLSREINICREGLFRKTGSLARQHELKTLIRLGENIDFNTENYTVHDCACVLKNFLAELQEPLLSEAHYTFHCQISDMCQDDMSSSQKKSVFQKQIKATRLLLLLLPPDNYCLLSYLLLLLNQIHNAQALNKMTSKNLAVLFAPHIICPKKMPPEELKQNFPQMAKCVSFLIENAHELFTPPEDLIKDVNLYLKDISFEGQLQFTKKETKAVKTAITFCERPNIAEPESSDFTYKALCDLHNAIENLPNSTRKRKLVKKLQKNNNNVTSQEQIKNRVRSRSVGAAIKRHIMKGSYKKKEELGLRHSAYDMALSTSKSAESIAKSKSVDALDLDVKEPSRFSEIKKTFLRASRKKVQKIVHAD